MPWHCSYPHGSMSAHRTNSIYLYACDHLDQIRDKRFWDLRLRRKYSFKPDILWKIHPMWMKLYHRLFSSFLPTWSVFLCNIDSLLYTSFPLYQHPSLSLLFHSGQCQPKSALYMFFAKIGKTTQFHIILKSYILWFDYINTLPSSWILS